VPNLECDVEALFEELVHRVSVLFLDCVKFALVCVFIIRVLSVTDLIVFQNLHDVSLHVRGQFSVVLRPNCSCEHLVEVQCLHVNLFLLALPLLSKSHRKGPRRDRHWVLVHTLDDALVQRDGPVAIVTQRQVVEGHFIRCSQFCQFVAVGVSDHRCVLVKTL